MEATSESASVHFHTLLPGEGDDDGLVRERVHEEEEQGEGGGKFRVGILGPLLPRGALLVVARVVISQSDALAFAFAASKANFTTWGRTFAF